MQPAPYDQQALKEIHAWKNPNRGWFRRAMRLVNWPLDRSGDLVLSTPGLGDAIRASVQGITGVCNDLARWSVRKEGIYAAFRKAGHGDVQAQEDIHRLRLEDIDPLLGWLGAKYKGMALAEGAGAGAAGLPGIPPDLIALTTLNLRAIGEYATYYGFDIHEQEERLFAMHVLGLASSPNNAAKVLAMTQLVRVARDLAKRRTSSQVANQGVVRVIQGIATALGIRLTKAKLAQLVPAAGIAAGGGFNAYFTSKVCDASYHLYRERFLARKYGADLIETVAMPARGGVRDDPDQDDQQPG